MIETQSEKEWKNIPKCATQREALPISTTTMWKSKVFKCHEYLHQGLGDHPLFKLGPLYTIIKVLKSNILK
jgi:hypothetical protein